MRGHPDLDRLDEHLDGSLDLAERASVEAHLRDCARCRSYLERSRRLMDELGALPREVTPPRDLRPAPPTRLDGIDVARFGRRWWPAAAVVVAALLGYGLLSLLSRSGTTAPGAGGLTVAVATADVIEPRLKRYEETSRVLDLAYRRQRDAWPAAATHTLDAQLEAVNRAIARTTEASAARPADPLLRDMLLARYETKVELLRRAVGGRVE